MQFYFSNSYFPLNMLCFVGFKWITAAPGLQSKWPNFYENKSPI